MKTRQPLKPFSRPILIGISALVILFILGGIVLIDLTFRRAETTTLEEHDKHLQDLAWSVDRNLTNRLSQLQDELALVTSAMEGSPEEMLDIFSDSVLNKDETVDGLLIYRENSLLAGTVGSQSSPLLPESPDYTYIIDDSHQTLNVCYDSEGQYYIALRYCPSGSDLTFVLLLELADFYRNIVADPLQSDNWVVFYDEDSGLLIQNHQNQPRYLVLNKDEIRERNDGYSILLQYQEMDEIGSETYSYASLDGVVADQHIVVIPDSATQNRIFAIAIAMDSREVYSNLDHTRNDMVIGIMLILLSICLAGVLIAQFWLLKAEAEKADLLNQTRIENSMHQIQPHFLYNVLGSIREIVLEDPAYASDLIFDFTTHLRACIKSMSGNSLVPFSTELKNIEAYVNIEKMRFGDKMNVIYDIQARDFQVPPLSIQPLVENAIRHGLFPMGRTGGTVIIRTAKDPATGRILVHIIDDGVGFDYDKVLREIEEGTRDSFGLQNLIFRLRTLCQATLTVNSAPGEGTDVMLDFPAAPEGHSDPLSIE